LDEILGHILFSPVSIHPPTSGWNGLGLAPVAVTPEWQRQGIGKALVHEGIERCKSVGCSVIVVLGDPEYYTQFGFITAANFGLGNEYQAGDEFMVIEISPGVLEKVTGMVKYAPEFNEVGV
jgi:putative acetyltransferase